MGRSREDLLSGKRRFNLHINQARQSSGDGTASFIEILSEQLKYSDLRNVYVSSKEIFNEHSSVLTSPDYIVFNHCEGTDISVDDILKATRCGCKLYVVVHDQCFFLKTLNDSCGLDVHSENSSSVQCSDSRRLLNRANKIVCNSTFTLNKFKHNPEYCSKLIAPTYPDLFVNYDYMDIPQIVDNTINIAVITNFTEYKGAECYESLFQTTKYKSHNITWHHFGDFDQEHDDTKNRLQKLSNVVLHGPYDRNEIFGLLRKHNIHGLVFCNKWPETYSRALTKGINSGLPIYYTKIGSFIERLRSGDRFISSEEKPISEFFEFIKKNQSKKVGTYKEEFVLTEDWYKLFLDVDSTKIDRYAVYFPQFHEIEENNRTFYKGYHDMKNLEELYKRDPSFSIPERGFYSLDNDEIINSQVEEAKKYGLNGFAIYWYWFGINNITNKNKIMDSVIDRFFKEQLDDFQIFFLWANEDWSNNPAFNSGVGGHKFEIRNTLSNDEITMHCNELVKYFKHPNYKKIDNKPVFGIHQFEKFVSAANTVAKFIERLDETCIQNGFSGVHSILKTTGSTITGMGKYKHYRHFPKIGSLPNNGIGVDYIKQLEFAAEPTSDILTLFNEHDMTARFLFHKESISRKTINLSLENYKKLVFAQLCNYGNRSGIDRIYLLNAWNEWGENMAFEPSKQKGDVYLKILNNMLTGE